MTTRILVMLVAIAWLATPSLAQQKVKIGFITTLSGPQAAIGQDMRDAVELALDHLGRKIAGLPVEVIYEDDTFKPDVGKQKSEKLVQQDQVHFVTGYIWSNVLLASLKTVVEDGDTFLISANAGPSQIAGEQCHKNFFSTSWQNDQTPMAMGELLNQRNVKKIYVMAGNYAAGKDMLAGMKRTFKGEVIGEDLTRWPDQLDFSAELSKIRAARPDAVFVFYPGAHGVQFLTQYAQAGLKGQVPLYTAFTIDAITLPQQKDLALGVPGAQHWVNDLPNEANKKFVGDFRKKYGRYPAFYGAQSYDAIMLIAGAVDAVAGDLTRKNAMRDAMRKANFASVRGPYKYNHNHFPIQNFYIQEVVQDAAGTLTLKTVETILKDHQDAYADKCPMQW